MSDLVRLQNDGDIALITIDNPPVNALSPAVRDAIAVAVTRCANDPAVAAIVVAGAGKSFVAGADIKDLAKVAAGQIKRGAGLSPLLLQIEDCPKPVVMAIAGMALGGGLELAMSGHYRVALSNAKVGQPEITLGLIPGAAGTQRLPRLAGVAKATEMCAGGKPITAPEALALGLVDRLIDGELLPGAIAFAREIAGKIPPKTRGRNEKLGSPSAEIFAAARDAARVKQRGMQAPLAAIDAVEAATRLSFEEGCQFEQQKFMECLFSDQAKALMHVFFSERATAKIPDVRKDTPVQSIKRVGVVGAGTMGGGIAMVFANAGIPAHLQETDRVALDRGLATIAENYATSVKRGRFAQEFVVERKKLILPTLDYDGFGDVDLVVEAVFEGMSIKKEVFSVLDRICRPATILASNTSSLDIDEIASSTKHPEAVLGLHFFSPANVMRLLEIVRGKATSPATLTACMHLAKTIGKLAVVVGNCRGFVGNRMFRLYRREAQFLVEEGSEAAAIDKALYEFGMAMGPLSTADLAGLDIGWRIRRESRHLEKPGIRLAFAEDRLCELGRFGQKTSAGWYRYDANRRPQPDPEVSRLIMTEAAARGIKPRSIPAAEIVDRCIYALVNEGARILEEGYAQRASDIDVIYLNGYGFPAYLGGPLWYADSVGLRNVYERVCEFEQQHGELWTPAPLLKELSERGGTFAELDAQKATAG